MCVSTGGYYMRALLGVQWLMLLLGIGIQSAAAQDSAVPAYDIDKYCESVSQAAGGSYQIKSYCVLEERQSLEQIREMGSVEDRVISYCDQVGQAAGGSYQIYEYCVKEELEAKATLGTP